MSLLTLCTKTVDIERKTTTYTSAGGHDDTFAAAYEDLRCTIQPASGQTMERFSRMSMRISHVLYTPTSIVLLAGDRVVDGINYYTVQWFADQGDRGRVFAAYLLKTD